MPITSAKELFETVLEAVDVRALPRTQMAVWFPTTNQGPTVFKSGEPAPLDADSLVSSIFFDDEVIRVYTLGKAPPNPRPADWIARPPTRFTLTRSAPTYTAEVMNLDTMAEEMIDEWNRVASAMSSAEVEREAVITWLASFGSEPLPPASELIQDFRDEVHLESDDDDDETDDDEPEVAGPTTVAVMPPAASAVSAVSVEPAAPSAPPAAS